MNKIIYKYPLVVGYNSIYMPQEAQILSVGCQFNTQMVVWALVDTSKMQEFKTIMVLPTGQYASYPLGRFLGTIPILDGTEFYHAFEAA